MQRVIPARQRLHPAHHAIRQTGLRLEQYGDAAILQGAEQIGFQIGAPGQRLAVAFLVEAGDGAGFTPAGIGKGDGGFAQQGGGHAGWIAIHAAIIPGDAGAARNMDQAIIDGKGPFKASQHLAGQSFQFVGSTGTRDADCVFRRGQA